MKRKRENKASSVKRKRTDWTERPTIEGLGPDASSIVFGYLERYTPITRLVCKQWSALEIPCTQLSVSGPLDLRITPWILACDLIEAGNLECLKWLLSKYEMRCGLYLTAVRFGQVKVLEYLDQTDEPKRYDFSEDKAYETAAQWGRLDALKYLKEKNFRWNSLTMSAAVRGNHRGVMEWLRDNGCPLDGGAFIPAALEGRLDSLQWLKDNGCPLAPCLDFAASRRGHIAVLQWLNDNGYVVSKDMCLRIATTAGQTRVVEWLNTSVA